MYCTHCGKQIEDTDKSCPYCGGGLPASDAGSAKEALKRAAGAATGSVRGAGNSANRAANAQLQSYTAGADGTAKGTRDDAPGFFTRNKGRGIIIAVLLIAVLLIVVFLSGSLFGKDERGKMAKDVVSAYFSDINIKYDIKSVKEVKGSDKTLYVVKFIAEVEEGSAKREEGSAVVAIVYNESAEILSIFPKSAYPQMEEFIDQNRGSIPTTRNPGQT